jgi:hypothetical protein
MSASRRSFKLVTVIILVALLFTACEIPDISRFTEQSSEMTRGIRKGVKDTENLLKAASERDDLFSDQGIVKIKSSLADYKKAMGPTIAALDGLDGYLEALNALSQANKKSGENARAAVNSVSNLVNAVTGFAIGGTTLDIATGLVALAEQFRTARDFKRRVTIAAEIVEGIHPVRDEKRKQLKDKDGQPMFRRSCTGDADTQIIASSKKIRETSEAAITRRQNANKGKPPLAKDEMPPPLSKDEIKALSILSPREKWQQLHAWGVLNDGELQTIEDAMGVIDGYHCGVLDFVKFNVQDLKAINRSVADTMYTNAREKNRVVLDFYESILANDRNVQKALDRILDFKALVPTINQYVRNKADEKALLTKRTLRNTLESIFDLEPGIKTAVRDAIEKCNDCGEMLKVLDSPSGHDCDQACRDALNARIKGMSGPQFDKSISLIEPILAKRAESLFEENRMYLSELERIKPSYDAVSAELNAMKNKQNQLDALLDSSVTALDAWKETHANLRVAVNTKKPLTAARLASKVREIWAIINPETD